MNDDKLKNFLKTGVSQAPEASPGESSRIWRKIESSAKQRTLWFRWAPMVAMAMVAVIFFKHQSDLRELRLEEEYLQQEWADLMNDVNSDNEVEFFTNI